jgi:hypothetical protein
MAIHTGCCNCFKQISVYEKIFFALFADVVQSWLGLLATVAIIGFSFFKASLITANS